MFGITCVPVQAHAQVCACSPCCGRRPVSVTVTKGNYVTISVRGSVRTTLAIPVWFISLGRTERSVSARSRLLWALNAIRCSVLSDWISVGRTIIAERPAGLDQCPVILRMLLIKKNPCRSALPKNTSPIPRPFALFLSCGAAGHS